MNTETCKFNTETLDPEIGMVNCPMCGRLIIPGQPHPPATPPLTDEELMKADKRATPIPLMSIDEFLAS